MAKQIGAASPSEVGDSAKAAVVDGARDAVQLLAEIFWKDFICASTRFACLDHRMAAGAALCQIAVEDADRELYRLVVRARHLISRLMGRPSILPRSCFREIAAGPDELAEVGMLQYLHDVHSWRTETRRLRGLWMIANGAGWFAPFERVCWLAERPAFVGTDKRGHLHCAHGPAIRYPDGATIYAWKGVRVPSWAIEQPERVTHQEIDTLLDPAIRSALIDIMTPERFIASGGAIRISSDETGTLWRRIWTHRGVALDSWSAVEVIDGTPMPNGSRKRYILCVPSHVNTAREAVAWTYGLSAEAYAGLEIRT